MAEEPANPGIPEENETEELNANNDGSTNLIEETEDQLKAEDVTESMVEGTGSTEPTDATVNQSHEDTSGEKINEAAEGDEKPSDPVEDESPKVEEEPQAEAPAEQTGEAGAAEETGEAGAAEGEGEAGAAEGEAEAVGAEQEGEAAAEKGEEEAPVEGAAEATAEGTADGAAEGEAQEAVDAAPAEGETKEEPVAEGEAPADPEAAAAEEGEKPSEHFADGERPESPPRVGEKLSREGSPRPEAEAPEHVPASTPPPEGQTIDAQDALQEQDEEEAEGDEEEEEEEEEEMVFDRELLIEKYRQAHQERQQLMQQNNVLQTKLAEYFRKKKADTEGVGKSEMEKSIADQEQRYLKYIANLEDLRRQYGEFQDDYREQIEELKLHCNDKQEKVDAETAKFMEFKKQTGIKAINSRSGKPIPPKELEGFLGNEHKKETEVVQVRLKNIKLQNQLRKEEMALKSKEELAEGLHLIDFEQLKIENQTYNEKIEERNEELLKLRKKITSTVQILTHLKEKLQFVQQENFIQRNRLMDVDATVAKKRDLLTRTKQSRDALRIDNQKLRQNCGLLGNEALLRNFEDCVDTVDDKKKRLDMMRMEHAELTLNYNGLKRKIEQAKSSSALGGRM